MPPDVTVATVLEIASADNGLWFIKDLVKKAGHKLMWHKEYFTVDYIAKWGT